MYSTSVLICMFSLILAGCGRDVAHNPISSDESATVSPHAVTTDIPSHLEDEYCDKDEEDFAPPEWDCQPAPPENCYYTVDSMCYDAALAEYRSRMDLFYMFTCHLLENAYVAYDRGLVDCRQSYEECVEGNGLNCGSTYQDCLEGVTDALNEAVGEALAYNEEKTALAEGDFLEAVQDCCELTCSSGQ